MMRSRNSEESGGETVISIIGPEMRVIGDMETEGTVRVEGTVEGDILAGKAVVVGEEGRIEGDVRTQDAVLSGSVQGSVTAASRLEIQATARIDGDIRARRIQLEEGAMLNGTVQMGEDVQVPAPGRERGEPARDAPVAPDPVPPEEREVAS